MNALQLQQQRTALRRQLLMQRLVVEREIAQATALATTVPRSHTMRFIKNNTGLVRVLGHSLKPLLTARLFKWFLFK